MHGPLCSFCIFNYCQRKRLKTAQQNEREEGGCGPRGKAVSGMRGCTQIGLWGSGLKQEAGRAVHGGDRDTGFTARVNTFQRCAAPGLSQHTPSPLGRGGQSPGEGRVTSPLTALQFMSREDQLPVIIFSTVFPTQEGLRWCGKLCGQPYRRPRPSFLGINKLQCG